MTYLLSLLPFAAAMWLIVTPRCFHVRGCQRCTNRRVKR